MKKITLTLMVITIGLLLSVPVFAFGHGPGYGPGEGRGPGYYKDKGFNRLNLTDEQKTKIEALATASQKEIRPLREKMFDKSVALRRLWLQTNLDKDKIIALQKEVSTLRDQVEGKYTLLRLEIHKLLTPEQQEKLANFGGGRRPGFGPRGAMRGQRGYGPGMGMYN
jgi:Spy/CpxP family protein refolding chaperone